MRVISGGRLAWGAIWLTLAGLVGCATPAVVFVSPDYNAQHITRVSVLGFADFPGQQGSGTMIADVFEKYLFNLSYQLVDASQAQQALQQQNIDLSAGLNSAALAALRKTLQVDAVVTGSISELTDTSEQTVMVDIPQEETEPVYQDVLVPSRHGPREVTEQTGTQTIYSDQSVPETETLPARVGLSARLVSTKNGELLWSGSASADGMDISSAAEYASGKITQALQKDLENRKPSPSN
jgi:hypothetical protein